MTWAKTLHFKSFVTDSMLWTHQFPFFSQKTVEGNQSCAAWWNEMVYVRNNPTYGSNRCAFDDVFSMVYNLKLHWLLFSTHAAPNKVPITLLASSFLLSYESIMLNNTTGWTRHTRLPAILEEENEIDKIHSEKKLANFFLTRVK